MVTSGPGDPMEWLVGKKSADLGAAELAGYVSRHRRVAADLGCGDGRYAYRRARDEPDTFFVGIDPARENLRAIASKTRRSARKGGLANLLFIVAAVENLPRELDALAHEVTVNFPWGSLLRGILTGTPGVLGPIARHTRPGGTVRFLLNDSLYRDDPLLSRLMLPSLDSDHIRTCVQPVMAQAGLVLESHDLLPNAGLPVQTSWGKRLAESHPEGATWQLLCSKTD